MDSEDSEQRISVTHQLPGRQLPPAPVEAVIRFGYPPDVVWPTYQQLVSTGSLRDIIQSDSYAAGGASGDARPYRHVTAAALLLASVENIVSSQFSDSLTGNDVSRSRAAVTRCGRVPKDKAGAGDLEGDGPEPPPRSANRPEGVEDVDHSAHDESPAARETTTLTSTPVTLTPLPLPPSPPPTPTPTPPTPQPTTTNASDATAPGVTTTTASGVMTAGASTSTPSSTTAASSAGGVEDTPGAESGTTTATSTPASSGVATAIPDEVPKLQTSSDTDDPTRHVTAASQSEDKARERKRQLEKLRALRAENRRLKARKVCRQCRQRPVALTFLPCGHFCFCQECGSSFHSCPLCRKTILADVRTFVS